jgi:hypothetical protein
LPELSELFKQFYDRLGLPFDEKTVARDLAASISHKVKGFGISEAKEWLHSPRAYGGFGRLPYNNVVFDWETVVLKKMQYTNVIIRVPDVNFYGTEVSLRKYARPYKSNKAFYKGEPLRLPTPRTMEEWEARLNGEDNPIKGKFGKMALDIIPLPSIDHVSTASMANFAQMWGYNVLPNLRGTRVDMEDRLIVGSITLVNEVLEFLKSRRISELAN